MGTWSNVRTWELVLPPSRPSAVQLGRIRDTLRGIDRGAPAAVLGSTPEFRDLLWECGISQVVVLERDKAFHAEMERLRVYSNEETVVWGDWLDTLPAYKSTFSTILSDLTMGNIPYMRRREFYHLLSTTLARRGIFIDKVLTHPIPHHRVSQLLTKYNELPLNLLHVNYFSCEMLFCSELLDLKEEVDSTLFYEMLQQQVEAPRLRAFLGKAELITPKGCRWWYGRSWERLKEDYCPELIRVAVDDDEPGSPYYGRLKHFVFLKE